MTAIFGGIYDSGGRMRRIGRIRDGKPTRVGAWLRTPRFMCTPLEVFSNLSIEFWLGTKVKEQSDFEIGSLEVIKKLADRS